MTTATPSQLTSPVRGLWATLKADFRSNFALDQEVTQPWVRALDVLTHPGFLAIVLFRISNSLARLHLKPLARLVFLANTILFGCEIYPKTTIGPGLQIPHPGGIMIAHPVVIGANCRIHQFVQLGVAAYSDRSRDGFPVIEDECWLMVGAMVLGPVRVGRGSKVGARALLLESVPPGSVVTSPLNTVIKVPDENGTLQVRPSARPARSSTHSPPSGGPRTAREGERS